MFLAYGSKHICYICLYLPTRRLYIIRHIFYNETVFPYPRLAACCTTESTQSNSNFPFPLKLLDSIASPIDPLLPTSPNPPEYIFIPLLFHIS